MLVVRVWTLLLKTVTRPDAPVSSPGKSDSHIRFVRGGFCSEWTKHNKQRVWSIERAPTHTEPSLLIRQISLENHKFEFLHPSAAWECLSRPFSVPDVRRSIDVPVSVTHTDSTCSNRRNCSPSSCSRTHKTEISHNEIDRFNSLFQLFDGVTMILSFFP